ncbi:MAG: hypothetical protein J6B87_01320 [Clostridia bacterium]|nr:hypothetical protein [Clostridia bacterium]
MDAAAILLIAVLIVMLCFHPGIQMLIEHLKSKSNKEVQEKKKCYHTADDCIDCVASNTCPMKKENVVFVMKHDRYTD